MKVALVYNLNRGNTDHEAEFDSPETVVALNIALSQKYDILEIEATKDIAKLTSDIVKFSPDVIFNIAEGFYGPAREAFYPSLYDQLGYKYTGPDATNLIICHNKYLTKWILQQKGVKVPFGRIISNPDEFEKRVHEIRYPTITKPNSAGSGLFIDTKSIAQDEMELKTKLTYLWNAYGSNILVEDYIEGKDISAIFVEGLGALGPCTISIEEHSIYDFEYKTIKDDLVNIQAVTNFPLNIKRNILEITNQVATLLDIRGYCKIDYRLNENGELFILEVNGQVSFHPQGEFMVCAREGGYDMAKIVNHIVDFVVNKKAERFSLGVGNG